MGMKLLAGRLPEQFTAKRLSSYLPLLKKQVMAMLQHLDSWVLSAQMPR
jgi:hypothetical protein